MAREPRKTALALQSNVHRRSTARRYTALVARTVVAGDPSALPLTLARPVVSTALSPWAALRANAGSAAAATAICLAVLIAIELGVFRSGLFLSQLRVSSPDFPQAKLALAARAPDTRVLYVGDSTVLTGIAPTEVSAVCA